MNRSLWILLAISLAALFAFHPVTNLDFWWHLKAAEWIVEHKFVPTFDPFTYTFAETPWVYNGWLGSVIWYIAYFLGSEIGVVILQITLVSLIIWIVFKTASLKTAITPWLAVFLFLGCIGISSRLFPRPHIFTLLIFSLLIYLLSRFNDKRGKSIWLIPILFFFWINLHAGALLGIAILLLYFIGSAIDQRFKFEKRELLITLTIIALSTLAIFINPYGARLALLPLHHAVDPIIAVQLEEWKTTLQMSPAYLPITVFYIFVGAFLINLAIFFKKIKWCWTLIGLFLLIVSLKYSRFTPLFIIFQTPLLYRTYYPYIRSISMISVRATLLMVLISTVLVYKFGMPIMWNKKIRLFPEWNVHNSEITPINAVNFIEESGIKGPVFNNQIFGGYLIWRLWPNQKVFIDGRMELFTPELYRAYLDTFKSPSTLKKITDDYSINYLMLPFNSAVREQAKLHSWLRENPEWSQVYIDGHAIIYARNVPENRSLIEQPQIKESVK